MPIQTCVPTLRVAAILLMVLLSMGIAGAQQNSEVLITVTGPWAYMQDPDNKDRIVIMAPDLTGHGHYPAQIYPWPDGQNGSLLAGQYKLVIENQGTCDAQAPHGAEQKATFFPLPKHFPQPGVDQIRKVIRTAGPRFAISLPKPCYYSSWHASYSIISENPIPIPKTGERDAEGETYTIDTVLHYFVTAVAPATLTSTPDGQAQSTSHVPFQVNKIEIDVRSDNSSPATPVCDAMSADSFRKEIAPFLPAKTQIHVWFPDLVLGHQPGNKGHYHEQCNDALMMPANTAKMQKDNASKALAGISALKGYVEKPVPGQEETMKEHVTTIEASIRSLQGALPKGGSATKPAFAEANQELKVARKALGSKKRLRKKDFEFSSARRFIKMATPGSGDCQGGQGSVDGTGGG